ncbi:hypothetical protein LCGC14_1862090 [marine sediment metagenome]|uniref:Uncharacterized protein n=1 Tax=marine sediment metagenome TaxID=412755 RepID=A0A0F9J669_9ZZZZ
MAIERINRALPPSDKIEALNNQTLELEGIAQQGRFDKWEVQEIYSGVGLTRKYKRDYSFGDAQTGGNAWYHWDHLKTETGYSIWQYDFDINYTHVDENQLLFDKRLCTYKGAATALDVTKFDKLFVFDGTTYVDRTVDGGAEGGTAFSLITDTSSYIYIGHATTFGGIDFNFGVRGANYTLKVEYSIGGTNWTQLTANVNDLDDDTLNFKLACIG